ncbi:MAG TPA: ATP synthase subunit I [Vicinamibacterales bacterium]|nr:ATP synthase subunit I [Vicinamibacterales bacterium]
MSDPLTLVLASMVGAVLGALFFGGLWWTVRRVVSAKKPALWVFGSLLLRTSVALAGFYVVSGRHLDRVLLCLLGFVMARLLVTRLTRSSGETERRPTHEASHAP